MMKTVNMTTGIEEIFQGSILIWRAVDSQWLMRDSQSSPETSHLIYFLNTKYVYTRATLNIFIVCI